MKSNRKNEPASAFDSETFGEEFAFEVKEPVGAMSISPCGRDVVLASRQGLHIFDLDSHWTPPRHLPHYTPWEVADVQWSPFASRDYWVVSTSNQKALVWNLNMRDTRSAVEHYLHAHTRAITDINFSAHHPDILATCAVDSYVHCWDLRTPLKPALSFADWFAGATQVKWNRQDSYIVASSHDRTAHIWDARNGASPLKSIQAHDTKIYGLDWNRIRTSALVTCSLDKTIKFWDYSANTTQPEQVIRTSFPIWRARHTPFGFGILAMPQRDDYSLHMYDRRTNATDSDISFPVKTFPGHKGQVKEFVWRYRGTVDDNSVDHREFQLITWSADQTLRLHPMDEDALAGVGYVKDQQSHEKLKLTRSNAAYKTFNTPAGSSELQSVKSSSNLHEQFSAASPFNVANPGMTLRSRLTGVSEGFLNTKINTTPTKAVDGTDLNPINWMKGVKAGKKEFQQDKEVGADGVVDHRLHRGSEEFESLGEEITHVGTKFGKVTLNKVNINERFIQLTMRGLWEKDSPTYLECRIDFPSDYPLASAPVLTITPTALLDIKKLKTIEQDVETIGKAYLRLRRSSLEAIFRYLHGDQSLEDALKWTAGELDTALPGIQPDEESSSDEDDIGKPDEDHESDFGLVESGLFAPLDVHANMPLAKGCAGVWCENGALVCFFPPKAKPTSLVGSLAVHRHDGLLGIKENILRNPFGRSRNKTNARSTSSWEDRESESDTDFSESGYSSSASSTSSHYADNEDVLRIAQHVFDLDHFELSKYGSDRILDATLHSVDSLTGFNLQDPPPKSVLSIYDLRDLLPAKEELAAEYICSGPEACQVNAAIATKHGYPSIAETWMLLDSILRNKFLALPRTVSMFQTPRASDPNASAVSSKTGNLNGQSKVSQRVDLVKWSSHPFGGRLVIQKLFEYYASLADIQMLAMMSCILSERDRELKVLALAEKPEYLQHGPGPVKNVRRFRDLHPFPNVSLKSHDFNTRASSIRNPATDGSNSGLLSSSYETVVHDNSSKGSRTLDTIPNLSFERQGSASKFSASPEWIRPLHKSGTNLANAIMALPLPFSLTTSAAASPPTALHPRKKPSPIGSLSTTSGWKTGSLSGTGVDFSHSNSTKNSDSRIRVDSGLTNVKSAREMTFKRKAQNDHRRGNSGATNQPLLDPAMNLLYEGWRNEYAEHLLGWGLLMSYAEVRRINGLSLDYITGTTHDQASTAGSESTTKHIADLAKVVVPVVHSQSSGVTICVLCNLPVQGRSSPCLVCGHVLHISCRRTWEHHDVGTPCATGCGCICSAPTIPPEGIVQISAMSTSQPSTPQLLRFMVPNPFSSIHSSRQVTSTIQDFKYNSSQNQYINLYPSAGNTSYSTLPVQGSHTPRRGDTNSQSSHDVAYAALQNIAAQSRPRANLTTSETSTRLRPSKSLLFANGFSNGNNSTSTLNEPKGIRPYRLGNSFLAGTSSQNRGNTSASSSRGKSRRSSAATSMTNNASSNSSVLGFAATNTTGRKQSISARQHDRRAFELDYTQTDDSDVDGI